MQKHKPNRKMQTVGYFSGLFSDKQTAGRPTEETTEDIVSDILQDVITRVTGGKSISAVFCSRL